MEVESGCVGIFDGCVGWGEEIAEKWPIALSGLPFLAWRPDTRGQGLTLLLLLSEKGILPENSWS